MRVDDQVRVLSTGQVGKVIEVYGGPPVDYDQSVRVEFPDGERRWYRQPLVPSEGPPVLERVGDRAQGPYR
jgi:hypothetical protein